MSICRSPIYKSDTEYENVMSKFMSSDTISETDFNESIHKTYFTNPKDFVLAMSISKTYPAAISSDKIERIPIESPYITTTLMDYNFNGYCASISFTGNRNFTNFRKKYQYVHIFMKLFFSICFI